MKDQFDRIHCNDITETIAQAMEMADDLEEIIILYQRKSPGNAGFLTAGGTTCAIVVWHLEKFKAYLLNTLNMDEL
jgi:hypothetical protein